MRHCVLQDSSFLIATLNNDDLFHADALFVFKKLMEYKSKIKIIIPALVFYETIVTLIKKGSPRATIEKKLWDFLYHDSVINVSLIETAAFKACRRLSNCPLEDLRTQDFIIANIGIEYDAQILTFDNKDERKS